MDQSELKEILRKHMAWRLGEEGGERANLNGADLRGADLREAYLKGAYLNGANLREANLNGAYLHNITCSYAKGLIVFYGPDYQITATHQFVKIGCKTKTRDEWLQVTESEACEMGLNRENFALYRAFIEILPEYYHSQPGGVQCDR